MDTNTDQWAARAGLSRRAVLSVGLAIPFLVATRGLFAQSVAAGSAPIDKAGLHALSVAVIGPKADDKFLSDAYHAAFTEAAPGFLVRASALADAMQADELTTPKVFSASSLARDEVSRATAIALTAAWYLGHVAHDDDGKVVAYEKALMWTPTNDIMVIPSYARGGPGYWADQIPHLQK